MALSWLSGYELCFWGMAVGLFFTLIWVYSLKNALFCSQHEIAGLKELRRQQAGVPALTQELNEDKIYRVLTTYSHDGVKYYFVTAAPEFIPFGHPIIQIIAYQASAACLPSRFRTNGIHKVIPV